MRRGLGSDLTRIGIEGYTIDRDTNGDGRVNVVDVMEVRRRFLTTWPNSEPALVASASASAAPEPAGRARPITRSVFAAAPILAG